MSIHIRFTALAIVMSMLVACGQRAPGEDGPDAPPEPPPPPPPFSQARAFNGIPFVVRPAEDGIGGMYIGGSFTACGSSPANHIARIGADGALDAGFRVGAGFDGTVYAIAPTLDGTGDIYVGGLFMSYQGIPCRNIARLRPTGELASGFDTGSGFDRVIMTLAAARDGSGDVYVAGDFLTYNGASQRYFVRLNADGSVDADFTVRPTLYRVLGIGPALDASGDVYLVGDFTYYDGNPANHILRLNADGSADTSFAVGSGFDFRPEKVVPVEDGSGDIHVSGWFSTYQDVACERLVRLNADGTQDPGFAPTLDGARVMSMAPARDGSGDLYVAGLTTQGVNYVHELFRLNADGSPDAGFAAGVSNFTVYGVAVGEDGDVHAVGAFTSFNGTPVNHIVRLESSGQVDGASMVGTGFDSVVYALAADGEGRLYAGGIFQNFNGRPASRLARLDAYGRLDPTFETGTGIQGTVKAIVPAADGSGDVYVGGAFPSFDGTPSDGIVRLNEDGSVDSGFAVGSGFGNFVHAIVPATDGSGDVYVGGNFSMYNGTSANRIVRLNSDGTRDTAFAVGTAFTSGDVWTMSAAVDGSGDIYVGGSIRTYQGTSCNYVIRLNADGTRDAGFVSTSMTGTVMSIAATVQGVYIGGYFLTYNGIPCNSILRLDPGGSIDTAFNPGEGVNSSVTQIAVAPDGSGDLYIAGAFTTFDDAPQGRIARLNEDGRPDAIFAAGAGFDNAVWTLAVSQDGSSSVYAGGGFASFDGQTMDRIARLGRDGRPN